MKVLFVCLGNICRSPIAEGVGRRLGPELRPDLDLAFDSAGTSAYHVGEGPDRGSVKVCSQHNIDISKQRSRQLQSSDFQNFDYLVAMDESNRRNILSVAPAGSSATVVKLRDFDPNGKGDVPDPWGGGIDGFHKVYDMVDRSMREFLKQL